MFFQITNFKFTTIVGAYEKKTEKQLSRKSNMRRYQQNGTSLSIQLTVKPHTGSKAYTERNGPAAFFIVKGINKKIGKNL